LSSTTSRCSITDDAATLLLGTSVLSSLKGGGLRQAEDPVNPLQPSSILSTKPGQLQPLGNGRPGAMLFDSQVSGPDTSVLHFRDDPSLGFAIFAKGYRLAASTLTQSLLSRPARPDYESYPVVFLYRHSLELYLKNVISKGARLARLRGQELQQKMLYIHDLTKLTSTAVGILRILFPRDSSLLEMLPKLEC